MRGPSDYGPRREQRSEPPAAHLDPGPGRPAPTPDHLAGDPAGRRLGSGDLRPGGARGERHVERHVPLRCGPPFGWGQGEPRVRGSHGAGGDGDAGVPDLRLRGAGGGHAARRRAHRGSGAGRALLRGGPGRPGVAVPGDGSGRGSRATRRAALHVRGVGARRQRRRAASHAGRRPSAVWRRSTP